MHGTFSHLHSSLTILQKSFFMRHDIMGARTSKRINVNFAVIKIKAIFEGKIWVCDYFNDAKLFREKLICRISINYRVKFSCETISIKTFKTLNRSFSVLWGSKNRYSLFLTLRDLFDSDKSFKSCLWQWNSTLIEKNETLKRKFHCKVSLFRTRSWYFL